MRLMRAAFAEMLGTGLLVAVVVGSGAAAARLSDDAGVQLLANSIATALALTVLIALFAPVSGAHLNPVVSLVGVVLAPRAGAVRVAAYLGAQLVGGIGGVVLANLMFDVPAGWATTERSGGGVLLGEVVATAGLILLVVGAARGGSGRMIAPLVGAYIGAAYWFTSSTAFANPAVTVARMFTDTFTGIALASVLPFLGAQSLGVVIGAVIAALLFPRAAAAGATVASRAG